MNQKMVIKSEKNNENPLNLIREIFKSKYVDLETGIQAYFLPRTDAHQSEYLADHDKRLEFISGFTGSYGMAIITQTKALLWTDGRYFLQAEEELYEGWELIKAAVPDAISPSDWIVQNLPNGSVVGFDPQLIGISEGKSFVQKLQSNNLIAYPICNKNFVDLIWENRPDVPLKKIVCLDLNECGELSSLKIERVREKLKKFKCDSIILTLLDDIAWLFNIRGYDISYNPLVFSVAIITLNDVFLFINEQKLSSEVLKHLQHVNIFDYYSAYEFIEKYHNKCKKKFGITHKIWIPNTVNYCLGSLVEANHAYIAQSPVQSMKAVKNNVELLGMRACNIRDSAAHVQFLVWLRREIELGHVVDELRAGKQIDYYRSQLPLYVSLSFETISACDEHAAKPHYHMDLETGKKLITNKSYYLVDSGGQYRDGTTDVTRTIYNGTDEPDLFFRKQFTRVLKGHINTALMNFPSGISGVRLDNIARQPLWAEGYDFNHGVGHGVGHYLNVHEGPVGLGHRIENLENQIKKGMIVTIEPGYYEEGHFGIRIENCYEIIQATNLESGKNNEFLTFSPLTLVPIQKNLIIREMLEEKHINWLNLYHNRCLEMVGKYLQESHFQEEYNMLAEACTPL